MKLLTSVCPHEDERGIVSAMFSRGTGLSTIARYAGFAAFLVTVLLFAQLSLKLIETTGHHFSLYSFLALALMSICLSFALGFMAMCAIIFAVRGGKLPPRGQRIIINFRRLTWALW